MSHVWSWKFSILRESWKGEGDRHPCYVIDSTTEELALRFIGLLLAAVIAFGRSEDPSSPIASQ
jgi:hypothetical protein